MLVLSIGALVGAPIALGAPTFTIRPSTVTEGTGGALNYFPLPIERSAASTVPTVAHVEVFPGSAAIPQDIVPKTTFGQPPRYRGPSFTIPAGSASFNVPFQTVGIVRDTATEADETFEVQVVVEQPASTDPPGPRSTITIRDDDAPPPNRPPVAVPDAQTTREDVATTVEPLRNDRDPDRDALTLSGVTRPAHGSASCVGGVCTYAPDPDFAGLDVFGYSVSDGRGGVASSTVTIRVRPVNDAPRTVGDVLEVASGVSGSVDVLANDTDPDGDVLRATLATAPGHGTASCSGRVCRYRPAAGFTGHDRFVYLARDTRNGATPGAVDVTVGASAAVVTLDDISVIEGAENPTILMRVTPGQTGVGHVDVAALALPGDTATPVDDFSDGAVAVDFALAFGPYPLVLRVAADRDVESDETYHVQLSSPVGVSFPGGAATTDGRVTILDDADADGLLPVGEAARQTDPADADTDDDGLPDGWEVVVDTVFPLRDLTDPLNADTDGDGLSDGLEAGIDAAGPDTAASFRADADASTTTNAILADTDGDGITDGAEDADGNGRVDAGETDPNDPADPPAPVAR